MKEEVEKKYPLKNSEAEIRKNIISKQDGTYSVEYILNLVLRRHTDKIENELGDFEGHIKIKLSYYPDNKTIKEDSLFLNFHGKVHNMLINNKKIDKIKFELNRLYIDTTKLIANEENIIDILFIGYYNHSGVGLHQLIDPIDKREYLYTQFEPYDCNRVFPCFDQPDIKAVLHLSVFAPDDWIVLGNSYESEKESINVNDKFNITQHILTKFEDIDTFILKQHDIYNKHYIYHKFKATPKISTYLYAICAGPYHCIKCPFESEIPMHLYMRQTLKEYGEPNEIFKITIAGMKFYAKYFGYKFPFDKYDQIFCPEYSKS